MTIVPIILLLCIPVILSYMMIGAYCKKLSVEKVQHKLCEEIIEGEGLTTQVRFQERGKPYYDIEKGTAVLIKGQTIKSVGESLHELGHAKDHKMHPQKDFGPILNTLFYFYFKYSILGLFITVILKEYQLGPDYMKYITYVFMASAIWFYFMILREEFRASKYGLEFCKKYLDIETKEIKRFKLCLLNGFISYLFVLCLAVMLTGYYFIL